MGGPPDLFVPTISTARSPFPPVLYADELEQGTLPREKMEGFSRLKEALLIRDLLSRVRDGNIATGKDLRSAILAAFPSSGPPAAHLFGILYGALQLAAREIAVNPSSDLTPFHSACGAAFHFAEGARDHSLVHHVEHFRVHAAVYLSAPDAEEPWGEVAARASETLDRWGDVVPPEAVLLHAMHNLGLSACGMPGNDWAYDLVKEMRGKVRRKEISQEAALDLLDERMGWKQSHGLERVLWSEILIPHHAHTGGRVRGVAEADGPEKAMEHAIRRGFCAEDGVPLARIPGMAPDTCSLSFPGGSVIGKTSTCFRGGSSHVLVDYGVDPFGRVPAWTPQMDSLDAVLITHSHLDHIGGLLPLYRNGYDGPWMGLPETGAISEIMLADSAYLAAQRVDGPAPYSARDLRKIADRFVPMEPRVEREVAPGVFATPYQAGHVYGSCQYLLRHNDTLVLVSGDINTHACRSAYPMELPPAEICEKVSAVVVEGTYAFRGEAMPGSEAAGKILVQTVEDLLKNKKPVLIPVLSLGRAQEVLAALSGAGLKVGVFGMARRVTEACGMSFGRDIQLDNRSAGRVGRTEYDVLVASAGCLQGGPSKEFFEREDLQPLGTVLTGYLFPGTPARALADTLPMARFSAHADHAALTWYAGNFQNAEKFLIHYPNSRREAAKAGMTVPSPGRTYPVAGKA